MNRVAVIGLIICAVSIADAIQVWGQSLRSSAPELQVAVEKFDQLSEVDLQWIEEALSSSKFSDRQHAMWLLGENSEKTVRLVQQAMQSSVPEVAARAEWIARAWQRGILLGEEDRVSSSRPTASRLGVLLEEGRFEAVLFALGITEDRQAFERVKKEVSGLLSSRFSVVAQRAVESQQLSKLVDIIDVVAEGRELALCRVQLLQLLGADFEVRGLLPKSAEDWPPSLRDGVSVLLLFQLGRIDEAIAQATELESRKLLHSCLMLSSRWKTLADDAMTLVEDSEPGSEDFVSAWSTLLIAADRSGNRELSQKATEMLSTGVFDESAGVRGIRWQSLAIHGHLDAALSILDPENAYFSTQLSIVSSRPERTFDVLGFPLDSVDSMYAEWVDEALEQQKVYARGLRAAVPFCPEVEKVVLLINCLNAVGRDDVAFVMAKRLCDRWKAETQVGTGTTRTIRTPELRKYLMDRISPVMRRKWAEELVFFGNPERNSKQFYESDRALLADSISDGDVRTLRLVLDAVRRLWAPQEIGDQIAVACQIVRGNTSTRVNVDEVLESMMAGVYRQRDTMQSQAKSPVPFLENLHDLLLKHGRYELAGAYLLRCADEEEVDAMLRIAESELSTGSRKQALEWYGKIEALSARRKSTGEYQRFGSIRNLDIAMVKTLIGRWVGARRIGDQELAASLKQRLDAVLCSPSLGSRMVIADYLREHGETALATKIYKSMLPWAVLSFDPTGTQRSYAGFLYDVVRKYVITIEDEQPSEAARLFDIAVIGMIGSSNYRATAYVILPLMIQQWRLESAIKEEDREIVASSLRRILELDPLDIRFSEEQLPLMREAGMSRLADEVLDQIMDTGVAYAKRFSCDAMTCNNVAWVAAKNERRLDEALELATLAVRAEPESTTYRDTLAEILFLQGRKDEALQIEQACLLDDFGEWHLHEQIKKFANSIQHDQR